MNRLVTQQSLLMATLVIFSVLSLSLIHFVLQMRTVQSVLSDTYFQDSHTLFEDTKSLPQNEQNLAWGTFMADQFLTAAQEGKDLTQLSSNIFNPRALLLSSALAILLGVFLAFIFSRRIVQPILNVASTAKHLSDGHLSSRVDKPSRWVSQEVKDLARDFNEMADLLERSEAERKALIADVAHELRTPLTIVQGNLDAMIDGYVEPTPENLSLLAERTEMLSTLVKDLRVLSLSDANRLTLDLSDLDLGMFLEHTLLAWQKKVEAKHIRLKLETQLERVFVKADRQKLTQVLDNLLGNALRFTPEGGVIKLGLEASADAYNVTVEDSGEGIPEADLSVVFERFYRGKTRLSGSGLGLSIAQSLVKLHGGSLSVRNVPDGGAEFEISLPS